MVVKIISVCLLIVVLFACLAVVRGDTSTFDFETWLRSLSGLSDYPKPPEITFTSFDFSLANNFPTVAGSYSDDTNATDDLTFWEKARLFFNSVGSFFQSIGLWIAYLPTFFNSFFQNFKVLGYALRDISLMIKYPFDLLVWFFQQLDLVTGGLA